MTHIYRITLLKERAHTFLGIFGLAQPGYLFSGPVPRVTPIRVQRASQSCLDRLDRKRRVIGDSPGEIKRLIHKLLVINTMAHESNAKRCVGIDDLSRKK